MRLLIVGSNQIYSIENFYVKYLKMLGINVSLFTAQDQFYEYYDKSVLNKLMYKFSLSGIIAKINDSFKNVVEQFNPDIIWVFKGMEILPASLQWAANRKIKLVNYNPDNPFIFSGKGSGNSNVTNSISLYDLHFVYNLSVKEKLEKEYKAKTGFLPFGFDIDDKLFQACLKQEEILKVCFAGNPDIHRVAVIEKLAAAGIGIDLFGNNWQRFVNNSHITVHPAVYGDDFYKILRRYRVQLNLMRPHNENSHNMRSFEVPGIGGIMLAPDTTEHRMFFTDQREVFLFSKPEDCIKQAHFLLGLSQSEANRARENARQRSLVSGYSYKERADTASYALENILN